MSSTNPFRTNNPTAENTISPANPPYERDNEPDSAMPVDHDPPPYTSVPAFSAGETTLEQGPARPFQPPPPHPASSSNGHWSHIQHHVLPNTDTGGAPPPRRTASLFQQITGTLNNVIAQIDQTKLSTRPAAQDSWSAYPGRQEYVPSQPPSYINSRPPMASPAQTGPSQSSDFVRDFYGAGTGEMLVMQPPPGPPPQMNPGSNAPVPDDGRPTTYPVMGHPLLNEGKVLVYPRGYQCDKCNNVGYKHADPSRPCKGCWKKYAKSFSGPLAYSFSSSNDTNFQRPLPPPPPQRPSVLDSLGRANPPGSFPSYEPPLLARAPSGPPAGAIVYQAGDRRIGGNLCWRCEGKGNVNFLFIDRTNCEVCGGIGRVFN